MELSKLSEAGEQFNAVFPQYCSFTDKIEILLTELLILNEIKYHVIESRTKNYDSFIEKIKRPGKQYSEPLKEIPDISGIRIIVYYTDDIKKIEGIIKQEFEIEEEELSHQTDEYDPDRFGYISVHYVVSLNKKRLTLPEWKAYNSFHFELQVRTVLQHSWAAVSHALQYKRESDVPSSLQRKLFRLVALFEIADDEFMAIRDSSVDFEEGVVASIKAGDSSIEINTITISKFVDGLVRLKGIKNNIRKFGYIFPEDDPDYFEDDETQKFSSSLVYHVKRIGVGTVGEFEKLLDYDPIKFLKKSEIGYW